MPRKTRKQKQAASARAARSPQSQKRSVTVGADTPQAHGAAQSQSTLQAARIHMPIRTAQPTVSPLPTASRQSSEQMASDKALRAVTLKDITRTAVVIGLLFGIQAALYYAHQNGYLVELFG